MYSFTDPSVLVGLSRCIAAFARISDVLSIDATADKLELSCVNVSRTVVARAVFPRTGCFTGPGAQRAIQVKSRAAEVVFSHLGGNTCDLSFGRVHNDVEVLEVLLESPSVGLSRVARLPCLSVHEPAPETEDSESQPYYFAMGLGFVKEVLSNCMPAAEEAELRFSGHKGFTFRAFRDKYRSDQTKLRAGVDTSVENEFRRFDGLEVLSPWASTMRLKELRTLVQLYDQLFPMNQVCAVFKRPGEPMIFETQHPETHISIMFRFTTKAHRSALDNTSSVLIRIGESRREIPHPITYGRPQSFMRRAAPPRIQRITSAGPVYNGHPIIPVSSEIEEAAARASEPEVEPEYPDHDSAVAGELLETHTSPIFVGYAEDDEIGMTQAASQAVGLFDQPPRKVRRQH